MQYKINNKTINIPDKEIENIIKKLDLTKEEAIQLWLEDNEYEVNEEQEELDKKASKVKIKHGASADVERKPAKERTVKVSDEKKAIFETILKNIDRCEYVDRENVRILKENKLIEVKIGTKTFKIDLIEQRPPKK